MPNPQYADARSQKAKQLSYDKSTMARPSKQGKESLSGPIYANTDKLAPKDFPMRFGTADWKKMTPGGSIKQQPRDRTWGIRQADGNCYDIGLARPEYNESDTETEESATETHVRGSVSKSNASPLRGVKK